MSNDKGNPKPESNASAPLDSAARAPTSDRAPARHDAAAQTGVLSHEIRAAAASKRVHDSTRQHWVAIWTFGLRHSFGFGHSSFVIRTRLVFPVAAGFRAAWD